MDSNQTGQEPEKKIYTTGFGRRYSVSLDLHACLLASTHEPNRMYLLDLASQCGEARELMPEVEFPNAKTVAGELARLCLDMKEDIEEYGREQCRDPSQFQIILRAQKLLARAQLPEAFAPAPPRKEDDIPYADLWEFEKNARCYAIEAPVILAGLRSMLIESKKKMEAGS